ncbi:unnamed protein product [Allacma fusca]|uniref:Farnesyl pyrophosphate synthase n=1 Tax=Allacma fusca TaxID=39272 RepID=A0A8J2K214_9HEXA|nr:unnamed protein product [Allacma fusca]
MFAKKILQNIIFPTTGFCIRNVFIPHKTNYSYIKSISTSENLNPKHFIPQDHYDQFIKSFHTIKKDISTFWNLRRTPSFISAHFDDLINYNVLPGKHIRAQVFILASSFNAKDNELDPNQILIFAWILEILQAASVIGDDMTDKATLRRGQTCWHLKESVGSIAINDMILLENLSYFLLTKYHSRSPNYLTIVEMVHDTTLKMCIGQGLDLLAAKSKDFQSFDMEFYKEVVRLKTSHFGFFLPMASALVMRGFSKQESVDWIGNLANELGLLYQIHDDCLDAFGDPKRTGKSLTDISNGKCCWPIVVALEHANFEQRNILLENYGQQNQEQVEIVKYIFAELNVEEKFRNLLTLSKANIEKSVAKIPERTTREMIASAVKAILEKLMNV